jgi:ketosteroid isomerase-like protein
MPHGRSRGTVYHGHDGLGSAVAEQNVELHRRVIAAYNAHDLEAFIAFHDPSIEFHTTMGVGGALYRGQDGLRRYFGDLEDAWGEAVRVEPEAFFDLGEHTLAFAVLHGRGRHSGAEVALPATHVVRWRNGLAVYFKAYVHREDALKDLAVSEDALEPIAP